MPPRKNNNTVETKRTLQALKIASENHPLNEIPPKNLDCTSLSENPLLTHATLLSVLSDPTHEQTPERLETACNYLAKQLKEDETGKLTQLDYASKSIIYRTMSERFLLYACANQTETEVVRLFITLSHECELYAERSRKQSEVWLRHQRTLEIENLKNQQTLDYLQKR